MADVHGSVAPGFEAVRAAFEDNFTQGREVGAAFSAYHRGKKVVDVWGGMADPEAGRTWDEHTIAIVFSTTKGITAMCANKLAQEGALDVDAPVAKYWPEFAAEGKQDIPVSYLLSHQAGLAWVEGTYSEQDAFTWDVVVDALARQAPHYTPGSEHGYHATTYGWLVGEVIRRITGKSVGAYFREAIGEPLGVDFWIGLPESEEARVAPMVGGLADPALTENPDVRALMEQFMGPETALGRALFAPGGALSSPGVWNTRALHAAEIPAANGIGEARGIARMYASCIGEVDGFRLLTDDQLKQATTQLTKGPNKILLDLDIQFGLGFMLRSPFIPLGGPRSFGHFGAGGSVGWADPDSELAFGYVMNKMDMGLAGDIRTSNLINACLEAVS
ncbi:MAG TPA: serine hydrolase domain-containing protein [Acidimicrobiia bacterium]|jgi:CubicO group peptidase (beta-lactamase class C family)|nr:serine hydrolase domain-containing protein [Acidimicrobiia bacterium]